MSEPLSWTYSSFGEGGGGGDGQGELPGGR
jgi:hypothetical protein